MTDSAKKDIYVRVKDGAGNDFLCPLEALKDPGDVSDDDLENCVDDGTVGRYASNIEVKQQD
jgi:hypothetical protein